jgi:hypothetical protein
VTTDNNSNLHTKTKPKQQNKHTNPKGANKVNYVIIIDSIDVYRCVFLYSLNYFLKSMTRCWWLTFVILAIQEVEIRRIMV